MKLLQSLEMSCTIFSNSYYSLFNYFNYACLSCHARLGIRFNSLSLNALDTADVNVSRFVIQSLLGVPFVFSQCTSVEICVIPSQSVIAATNIFPFGIDPSTCCWVYGPEIEFRWLRTYRHPFRPVQGPTQPPVQWVPCHSRG
jgi:hypothetical protein